MRKRWKIDYNKPWRDLPKGQRQGLLWGFAGEELTVHWDSEKIQGQIRMEWEGLLPAMLRRYKQTQSEHQKKYYAGFMSEQPCTTCHGFRLKPEVLAVKIKNQSIVNLTEMTIGEVHAFLSNLKLTGNRKLIGDELVQGDPQPPGLSDERGPGLPDPVSQRPLPLGRRGPNAFAWHHRWVRN